MLGEAKELRAQVGVAARRRIDEYMSIVRSLEERTERASVSGKNSSKLSNFRFSPVEIASRPRGMGFGTVTAIHRKKQVLCVRIRAPMKVGKRS